MHISRNGRFTKDCEALVERTLGVPKVLLTISSTHALDPASELRIGRTSNRLLAALCAIEQRAMRLGCPLPAGGSLLAVARRTP